MAKKIIIIFLLISCLSLTVSAAYFQQVINPANMFLGYGDILGVEDPFSGDIIYSYYIRQYFWDQSPKESPNIVTASDSNPIIGIFCSNHNADSLYKFSIGLDITLDDNKTGYLNNAETQVYLVPTEIFTPIDVSTNNVQDIRVIDGVNLQDYQLQNAKVFYDKTSKLLSCIYQTNDTVYDMLDTYLIIALPAVNYADIVSDNTLMTLTSYTGTQPIDSYTNILNEISNNLEQIAGSSGGLTEEQVNQAIQDALTAHDQMLEQEVDSKLDQIMEQITGIVSPYSEAADQINTAFDGLSDVFASTSTASVFKFPAGRMPNGVVLWQEHNIDIGAAWLRVPAKFRAVVQIVCTFTILYAVIQEAIFVIRFIILGRKGAEDD